MEPTTMPNNFITREEFAATLREHRQEQKDGRAMLAKAMHDGLEKTSLDIRDNMTVQIGAVKDELVGVNKRLDTVNGRIYRHEGQIAAMQARTEVSAEPMSRKTKAAVMAGGGIGILAVIHSLFEMLKEVGPVLLGIVGKH